MKSIVDKIIKDDHILIYGQKGSGRHDLAFHLMQLLLSQRKLIKIDGISTLNNLYQDDYIARPFAVFATYEQQYNRTVTLCGNNFTDSKYNDFDKISDLNVLDHIGRRYSTRYNSDDKRLLIVEDCPTIFDKKNLMYGYTTIIISDRLYDADNMFRFKHIFIIKPHSTDIPKLEMYYPMVIHHNITSKKYRTLIELGNLYLYPFYEPEYQIYEFAGKGTQFTIMQSYFKIIPKDVRCKFI